MKIAGREAGNICVIVKKVDDTFVMITGPRAATHVKRRKCNVTHLEPLPETLVIKADASDEDVIAAYEKAAIFSKYKISKPTAEQVKQATEARQKGPTPKHEKAPVKKKKEKKDKK